MLIHGKVEQKEKKVGDDKASSELLVDKIIKNEKEKEKVPHRIAKYVFEFIIDRRIVGVSLHSETLFRCLKSCELESASDLKKAEHFVDRSNKAYFPGRAENGERSNKIY